MAKTAKGTTPVTTATATATVNGNKTDAETPKFKATQQIVVVVPSKETRQLTLTQSIATLQILLALHLSKTPHDIATFGEYEAGELKGYPLPLLHHSPSGVVLFAPVSAVKYVLGGEETGKEAHLEPVLRRLVDCRVRGDCASHPEHLLAIIDDLNKHFSTSLASQIIAYAVLRQTNVDGARLSGQINSWLAAFSASLNLSGEPDVLLRELLAAQREGEESCPVRDAAVVFVPPPKHEKVVPCENGETRNILITAALPYVNNVPHLGNIVGAVLSGDVHARYCRLMGYRTLFVCGTDEYGTATETKALEEGVSCKALCDKYFKMHAAVYDWFQIQFDVFGRSSTAVQTEITHEIFDDLYRNGFFFEQSVDQCYCEQCARFLADRYVEGTCPLCGFADARGDQCDGCGKLLNATELKQPQCKLCRHPPVVKASRHLFLDLTKLQPECEQFVETAGGRGEWSANSLAIARAWLTEGLRPRCMTRDLKWGTSVPLAGYDDKVFYVWFDAPIGYISITAGYDPAAWRRWWQAPDSVQLHQFMGKDNVPFHTVIFPSTLLGTRRPWTMLHHLSTTDFLNYEGGKFSKSRGTGVFGTDARTSGIPAAIWRYYLLATRPESTDAAFSWSDFVAKTNSELLANLGNFVNRTTRFVAAKLDSRVPAAELLETDMMFIAERIDPELARYHAEMGAVRLRAGLKAAMAVSAAGNLYLAEQRLDGKLLQSDPARCGTVLAVALSLCYQLSALLDPFLPSTAADIRAILRLPMRKLPERFSIDLCPGHRIGTPFHLFDKLEETAVDQLKARFAGKTDAKLSVTEAATR